MLFEMFRRASRSTDKNRFKSETHKKRHLLVALLLSGVGVHTNIIYANINDMCHTIILFQK